MEEEHYMETPKANCKSCRYMVRVTVAGDDRRIFCSNDDTKLLVMPIGYITDGNEALSCGYYEKGKPDKENLLTAPNRKHKAAPNPTVYLLDGGQPGMMSRHAMAATKKSDSVGPEERKE
jgi:hypothetical protein